MAMHLNQFVVHFMYIQRHGNLSMVGKASNLKKGKLRIKYFLPCFFLIGITMCKILNRKIEGGT